jgi:hypothetical protein
LTQFLQSQVRPLIQQQPNLLAMVLHNHGFSPRILVSRSDVARTPALLEKLFDHAQRNAVTLGYLLTGTLVLVVGS